MSFSVTRANFLLTSFSSIFIKLLLAFCSNNCNTDDMSSSNEKITLYGALDGIALEHIVRFGPHNMKSKHFHPEYEIFYILEGERVFFYDNRIFTARKGDL